MIKIAAFLIPGRSRLTQTLKTVSFLTINPVSQYRRHHHRHMILSVTKKCGHAGKGPVQVFSKFAFKLLYKTPPQSSRMAHLGPLLTLLLFCLGLAFQAGHHGQRNCRACPTCATRSPNSCLSLCRSLPRPLPSLLIDCFPGRPYSRM